MASTRLQTGGIARIETGGGMLGRRALVAFVFAALAGIVAMKWSGLENLAFALASAVLIAGFAIATVAWLTKAPWDTVRANSWDIAGALVFVGFGAAIIGT